jgi:hypothetical protein
MVGMGGGGSEEVGRIFKKIEDNPKLICLESYLQMNLEAFIFSLHRLKVIDTNLQNVAGEEERGPVDQFLDPLYR